MRVYSLAILFLLFTTAILAQFETEIHTSGITFPRLSTIERDSTSTMRGTCIYNTDSQRIECCHTSSQYGTCNWEARSTILIDDDFDTYIATRHIDHGDDLFQMSIKGMNTFLFRKDTFYNGRIEIPQNLGNVILGGHTTYDPEGEVPLTDITDNILIGYQAGHSELQSSENVLIGTRSGYMVNYPKNVMIGYEAGPQIVNSIQEPIENVYIGYKSGNQTNGWSNTAVGSHAGADVSGRGNTFIGQETGQYYKGDYNIAVGHEALKNDTQISFTGTFSNNIALGYKAGYEVSGNNNIFLGTNAGSQESQMINGIVSNTLIIDSGAAGDLPLIKGNFVTNQLTFNGDVGIGMAPSEKLEIDGSVKIHQLLKLSPMIEPHSCAQTSQVGDIYLSSADMILRICIGAGTQPSDFKWSEMN